MTEENPFASPNGEQKEHYRPSRDQSVQHEPHVLPVEYLPTQKRSPDDHLLTTSPNTQGSSESVWDEPAIVAGDTATPDSAMTYARWLNERVAATSGRKSWLIAILAGVLSGFAAIALSLLLGVQWAMPKVMLFHMFFVVTAQEAVKTLLPIMIVERRPYLYKSTIQIMASVAIGGLLFPVVEKVATWSAPQSWLTGWNATFYMAMHILCSLSVGIGLSAVWREAVEKGQPPAISNGAKWLGLAVAIRLLYFLLM